MPLNRKIITSNILNMGFISVPNLVPGFIFNVSTVSSTPELESSPISLKFAASDSTPDQLCLLSNREGIKEERKNGERGWGDYFKYFRQRGAINRGMAIIDENGNCEIKTVN